MLTEQLLTSDLTLINPQALHPHDCDSVLLRIYITVRTEFRFRPALRLHAHIQIRMGFISLSFVDIVNVEFIVLEGAPSEGRVLTDGRVLEADEGLLLQEAALRFGHSEELHFVEQVFAVERVFPDVFPQRVVRCRQIP